MGFKFHTLRELDDSEGTVQLHKTGAIVSEDADISTINPGPIVLVPQPSASNPNDPLRWSRWRKRAAFMSVCAFTFLTNYGIGGLSPAFYMLSIEFDKTMTETSDLLLWPILVLGLCNFVWVPLANYLGTRPVFVFTCLLLTISYIWGAVSNSFNSLLWSNIIAAFAGSSTESLGAGMVNDLFFLHERGTKMGIYMNFIAGGNTVGPLFCAFTIQGLSWRWHKWIAAILTGLNFLAVLFLVPETRFRRETGSPSEPRQAIPPTLLSSSGKSDASTYVHSQPGIASEKNSADGGNLHGTSSIRPIATKDASQTEQNTPLQVPLKPYLQTLRLLSPAPPNTPSLPKLFVRPLTLIVYASVFYAFLAYAISLVLTVAINILNSFVLQAPPYGFSPLLNGLINISGLIGNILGAYAGGWLTDVWVNWRTRKGSGIFVPETRLWMLGLPIVITTIGCLLWGYGVQEVWNWSALYVAYGMVSFALTAVPTTTLTYMSDCLYAINADTLLLVNGLKNVVAFGFLYAIVPWVEQAGYVTSFGVQAGIYVAIVLLGAIGFICFGARIRHAQAGWRVILA